MTNHQCFSALGRVTAFCMLMAVSVLTRAEQENVDLSYAGLDSGKTFLLDLQFDITDGWPIGFGEKGCIKLKQRNQIGREIHTDLKRRGFKTVNRSSEHYDFVLHLKVYGRYMNNNGNDKVCALFSKLDVDLVIVGLDNNKAKSQLINVSSDSMNWNLNDTHDHQQIIDASMADYYRFINHASSQKIKIEALLK
jgi:hypothetical protein